MKTIDVSGAWPTVFEAKQDVPVVLKTPSGSTQLTLRGVQHVFEADYWTGKTPDHKTFAEAKVEIEVNGKRYQLLHRPYEMPVTIGGVRLYVETTREWLAGGGLGRRKPLDGDVRLSAVPAGQTWGPESAVFPIANYRWRSSTYRNTWAALVPFNVLYYHRGEDFGAIPDRLDLLAMLPGVITHSPLPSGDGRSNSLTLDVGDNVKLGYAHMNTESIKPEAKKGASVTLGMPLAKTGMTWNGEKSQHNDPHVHMDLQRDGVGFSPYPMMVESYFRTYSDPLIAVAGGFAFTTIGQSVDLDGSRSVARPGRSIRSYRWRLHDGTEIKGAKATVKFDRAGYYAQELIVVADDGSEDRDAVHVRVYDPASGPDGIASGWVYSSPTRGIKAGDPVTFWSRLGGSQNLTIDFGDGSAAQPMSGDASHAYARAGIYTVTFRGSAARDENVIHKLRVRVE